MNQKELQRLIGKKLRSYRTERGLTQDELAEKAGISTSFYANIEIGNKGMSLSVIKNLSDALNVSIDSLMTDDCRRSVISNIDLLLRNQPDSTIIAFEKTIRIWIDEVNSTR